MKEFLVKHGWSVVFWSGIVALLMTVSIKGKISVAFNDSAYCFGSKCEEGKP